MLREELLETIFGFLAGVVDVLGFSLEEQLVGRKVRLGDFVFIGELLVLLIAVVGDRDLRDDEAFAVRNALRELLELILVITIR